MANEELIALIERRFDELQTILLDPKEQLDRMERGDHTVDERLRRIHVRILDLEKRLDDVRPKPDVHLAVTLLQDRMAKAERAHAALEARVMKLEKSDGSTSSRKPRDA